MPIDRILDEQLYDVGDLPTVMTAPDLSGAGTYFFNPNVVLSDLSADPYAGTVAGNGKPIWTPEDAADNLNRYGVDWTQGNYGALDDGVLTYGFWTFEDFLESYYFELRYADGSAFNDDAYYAEAYGAFEAFTAEQEALAAQSIGLWGELIDVEFQRVDNAADADITFASVYMSPAAGAHAYYPQAEALNEYYGTTGYGNISGDVFINWLYADTDFTNVAPGDYGLFALTHELGHSLGLAHGGDYNASAGTTITYEGNAYFYQDSQQYTIMSYFAGSATGAGWVDWSTLTFRSPSTPMVHDILAVQNVYGANTDTRAGDTVYGFNSTADNDVLDFTINTAPVVTIYDAGGHDTLDLSGWSTNEIIDLNPGEFSSASAGVTMDYLKSIGFLPETYTAAQLQALFARYHSGTQGQMTDNIAIAYGTIIEDAIAGSGNDTVSGNAADNGLWGNAGNDTLFGRDGNDRIFGGAGRDVIDGGAGNDVMTGGAGNDVFLFSDIGGSDRITDLNRGHDIIDLSAIDANANADGDQAFRFIAKSAFSGTAGELRAYVENNHFLIAGDVDGDGVADFIIEANVMTQAYDFVL